MQARENRAVQKRQSLDMIDIRRNPYLLDYEEQKRLQKAVNENSGGSGRGVGRNRRPSEAENMRNRRSVNAGNGRSSRSVEVRDVKHRKQPGTVDRAARRSVEVIDVGSRRSSGMRNDRGHRAAGVRREDSRRSLDLIEIGHGNGSQSVRTGRRTAGRDRQPVRTDREMGRQPARTDWRAAGTNIKRPQRTASAGRQRNAAAAKKRRRKQVLQRKIMAAAWVLCIFMIGWLVLLKKGNASELDQNNVSQETQTEETQNTSSVIVQGISSEQFAKHPSWTEDFLPVNEFSRPGETLSEVRDIFVHYTANPGTSAAQNRSYFEQQKDMHEASVSAHFIIGYEGEVIQCVPLDEIAYAVQTRNYDSISIECCYKASDGSFTQETYDSLISLLTWLTETYHLDTSHILRHYDCGGKKCPLYYTEHEDAWAQLKADVAARQTE